MSFLLTGPGRTGTTSLAKYLGVPHELDPGVVRSCDPFMVSRRFRDGGPGYGEVSSLLRRVAPFLDVEKKGVLVRNPYEITISALVRWEKKRSTRTEKVQAVLDALLDTERLLDQGFQEFRFEEYTKDPDTIAKWAGVPAQGDLPWENATPDGEFEFEFTQEEMDLLGVYAERWNYAKP